MSKQAKRKTKNPYLPLLRWLVLAFFGIIFGWNIYLANANFLAGNQLPMPFGYGLSVVVSGSMEPRLSVDDLIIVKAAEDYGVNDIVLFQEGSHLVIHRIVAVDGDTVTTKGDANNTSDAPIPKSRIKGVLVCDFAGLGKAVDVLKHPVSVCILLTAAIVLLERSYRIEQNDDRKELEEMKAEIEKLKQDH